MGENVAAGGSVGDGYGGGATCWAQNSALVTTPLTYTHTHIHIVTRTPPHTFIHTPCAPPSPPTHTETSPPPLTPTCWSQKSAMVTTNCPQEHPVCSSRYRAAGSGGGGAGAPGGGSFRAARAAATWTR